MRRARSLLTGCALGALTGSLLIGNMALAVGCLVASLPLAALWIPRAERHAANDQAWSAPRLDGERADRSAGRSAPPPAGRIARSLGRVEAREVLTNPWFAVGVGLCVVMVLGFAPDHEGAPSETRGRIIQDLLFLAHPLVGMTVLAGHHAASRANRDRAVEVFESCPTSDRTRAAGVALAAWVPVAVLAAFFASYVASADWFSPIHAEFGPAAAPNVAAGVALGAGGLVLGLAVGRWIRSRVAPLVAVALVGLISIRLADVGAGAPPLRAVLSTFPPLGDPTPTFSAGQAWAHAAWIAFLVVLTAAVAVFAPSRGVVRTERP